MKNMTPLDRVCALKTALEERVKNLRVGVLECFGFGQFHLRLHGYDSDIQLPVSLTMHDDGRIMLEYSFRLNVPREQREDLYDSLNQFNSITAIGAGGCYVYSLDTLSFHALFWAEGRAEDVAAHICDALSMLAFSVFTLTCPFGDGTHHPLLPIPEVQEYFSITALRMAAESFFGKKC